MMSKSVPFAAADMPLGVMSGHVPAEFASGAVAVNLVATGGHRWIDASVLA